MQAKLIKSQFNNLCVGGMLINLNRVSLYAGSSKMNCIEVGEEGINIQSPTGSVVLNTTNVKGVGFSYMTTLADFVPYAHIFMPQKNISPILEHSRRIVAIAQIGSLIARGV